MYRALILLNRSSTRRESHRSENWAFVKFAGSVDVQCTCTPQQCKHIDKQLTVIRIYGAQATTAHSSTIYKILMQLCMYFYQGHLDSTLHCLQIWAYKFLKQEPSSLALTLFWMGSGGVCLWRFGVKFRHSRPIRAVSEANLSSSGLEEAL